MLLWITAFVMDYVDVRRAALAKKGHPAPIDPMPLIQAEVNKRAEAIEAVYVVLYDNVKRINESINDLRPKPTAEPTLKQRVIAVCDDLKPFLAQYNSTPEPSPRSPEEEGFDWSVRRSIFQSDWRSKMGADFRLNFCARIPPLIDEIEVRCQLPHESLQALHKLLKTSTSSECTPDAVDRLRSELWVIADRMNN